MTQVRRDADLGALARVDEVIQPPKRGWLRVILPLAIIAAFLWVLRGSLVELLRPRVEVTLVRPTPLEGGSDAGAGADGAAGEPATLAVQAAGWIEPDPFPSFVPALSGGVVQAVLVEESDAIDAGSVVARLVPEDALLERQVAEAAVARAEASLQLAEVRAGIANERFDAALEVTEAAARARARALGRAADAEQRAATLGEGEALIALAESELVVQRELAAAGASGARQVEIAEADLIAARAKLAGLRAELALSGAMAEEAVAERVRAERDLELRFADRLERDSAGAEVGLAEAELAAARADLAEAALRVERTTIVAPLGGVVLERLAADGDALEAGAPVCTLYDPARLRVRVDVPQGDVEKLFVGQAAEVLSESRGGRPYRGEVLRIVQRADIQKVTLEAQVRVIDADGLLRPDMLTQVRFLSARADGAPVARESAPGGVPRAESATQRVAISAHVLDGDTLWVYDPLAEVARKRTIERGGQIERSGATGLVEVRAGLLLTDKVVDGGREALAARGDAGEGVAVRVAETPMPVAETKSLQRSKETMSFIELNGVTRRYVKGEHTVTPLLEVDLAIEATDFMVLLGPSGSGKTTLLNLLAGIDRPQAGTVRVGGFDVSGGSSGALARWRARTVGYVFQRANLVPVLTAYENVELPLWLQRMSRKERHRRVSAALEMVGLADRAHHLPKQLSGGQEQRVSIARAIVADPPLVVADEPTGSLDSDSADGVLTLLRRLQEERAKTIVMVTHDSHAASFGRRVLSLDKGKLRAEREHAPLRAAQEVRA